MFRSSTIAIVKRNDSHSIGLGGAMEPASAAWKVMDHHVCKKPLVHPLPYPLINIQKNYGTSPF